MKLVCLSHIYQRTLAIFVKADVGGLKKIYNGGFLHFILHIDDILCTVCTLQYCV